MNSLEPDILFLDVQMPVCDGFEALRSIEPKPLVVFITAYDEYAIKAFEINAIDYILKPYTKDRISKTIERITHSDRNEESRKVRELLREYEKRDKYLKQITVRDNFVYQAIPVSEVELIRREEGVVLVHTRTSRHLVDAQLNHLEARLDPGHFFRAHRSAIVNLSKIRRIIPWGSARLTLEVGCDSKVHVSRYKMQEFKYRIGLKI